MSVLDLDHLTKRQSRLFNSVAAEIRGDYNRLVMAVSDPFIQNFAWSMTSIASRNKYNSPLFIRCCQIAFVQRSLREDARIERVISKDFALIVALRSWMEQRGETKVEVSCSQTFLFRIWRSCRPLRQYLVALVMLGLRCAGRSKKRGLNDADDPITLIDTFVLNNGGGDEGSISRGKYHDRYFPGLMEQLSEDERKNIFYLPTIIGFRNPLKAFALIRKAKERFLIHDDFLKISDYLFALGLPFKMLGCRVPHIAFRGVPMRGLLVDEKRVFCCDFPGILGALYYRFAKRLSEGGVRVRLVVDWYENQLIDRGLVMGVHEFLPDTTVVGYQGYVISPSLHLYVYPNEFERKSNAVPDVIYVVGDGLRDRVKEFSEDIVVRTGPAFRFNQLWAPRVYSPALDYFTILVGLPIGLPDCTHILNLLIKAMSVLGDSRYRFLIKPHPTYGPEAIKGLIPGPWPERFVFTAGDFRRAVEESNLLLSNASSVSLEALAKGVPAIVIAPESGILQNPIPEAITQDIWSVVYDVDDLVAAICRFERMAADMPDGFEDLSQNIRSTYFNKVTRENTLAFLNMDAHRNLSH